MAITLAHFLINSLMRHFSKMKWHFTAVVWENPDNTLIYNTFSKLLKVSRKNVYSMEIALKKIALSLPHSTCHVEKKFNILVNNLAARKKCMILHTRSVQIQPPVWNHPTQEVKGKFIWKRQAQCHFLQLVVLKSSTSFETKKIIFYIVF